MGTKTWQTERWRTGSHICRSVASVTRHLFLSSQAADTAVSVRQTSVTRHLFLSSLHTKAADTVVSYRQTAAANVCSCQNADHNTVDSCTYPGLPNRWLYVACLTSQQHASVSQGQICSDNFTCCHTEIEVADQTFYLTQSQYTDTGPTSPRADPIMPGAWQGSHWSANF